MKSSDDLQKATIPALPPSFWAALAEKARRIVSSDDSRALGGISRERASAAAAAASPRVPLSTFKMIGLAEIQAKLADRWHALSDKVHMVAQNTISKHLLRGDAFERYGDDGYLVLFATLGPDEAEFKSRIIAKELAGHLLGEGGANAINVSTLCTTVSLGALTGAGQIAALVEAMTRASPPREPNADALAAAGLAAAARPKPANPFGQAGEGTENSFEGHAHAYSPVWDLTQKTLLRFRASLCGAPPSPETDSVLESEFLRRDLILIRRVIEDLRALLEGGRRLPITIPVHHASLGSGSHRTRLFRAFAEAPPLLRKLITVEFCFPHDDFWTYPCETFLEMARPLGMGWSALIALERPRSIPPGRSWLSGVGSAISGEARTGAENLRLMTDFGQRSRTLNLECTLYGMSSRALVLGAVGAGFRYLSGPAIHPDVPSIANALRFEPLDLYRDMVRRSPAPGAASASG